jgi:hypothetical protein
MRLAKQHLKVPVAIGLIFGSLLVPGVPATAGPAWSFTPTPNPAGATKTFWNGVACPTTTMCFAVGRSNGKATVARRTGGVWKVTFSPVIVNSVLHDIACPTETRCVAVGTRRVGPGLDEAFIEHWNGSNWTKARAPDLSVDAELFGVSCPSRTNCIAVGRRSDRPRTLVERWNGKKWSIVPSKNPGSSSLLQAVSCPSAKTCFAVGMRDEAFLLVERWNGTAWSVMKGFNIQFGWPFVTGVSCPTVKFCVATGWTEAVGTPFAGTPFFAHFNGSRWSKVDAPTPSGQYPSSIISGVHCPSAASCFAVGTSGTANLYQHFDLMTLVEHWDGTSWSITESSTPDASGNAALSDVWCATEANCHAVGGIQNYAQSGTTVRSLAEVYE